MIYQHLETIKSLQLFLHSLLLDSLYSVASLRILYQPLPICPWGRELEVSSIESTDLKELEKQSSRACHKKHRIGIEVGAL